MFASVATVHRANAIARFLIAGTTMIMAIGGLFLAILMIYDLAQLSHKAQGRNRWLVAAIISLFLPFGIVIPLIYFIRGRKTLTQGLVGSAQISSG